MWTPRYRVERSILSLWLVADLYTYLATTGILAERVNFHHTEEVHSKYVSRGGGFVILLFDRWVADRPDFVRIG